MLNCPRCHQPVETKALVCPYCRITLKAHGHPGMPLYRASGQEPLCLTCMYHEDDSCNFPKRPHAVDCTLYSAYPEGETASHRSKQKSTPSPGYTTGFLVQAWLKRNLAWLLLFGLVLISLLVALAG